MPQTYSDSYILEVLDGAQAIALLGASAKPERPSHGVMAFLQRQGYRVIPINPGLAGQTLLGETVYASLKDAPGPFEMVDVFRSSDALPQIVEDVLEVMAEKGVESLWTQLNVVHEEAAQKASKAGLKVIMDRCPAIELPRLGRA